jgi:hypothetical protein
VGVEEGSLGAPGKEAEGEEPNEKIKRVPPSVPRFRNPLHLFYFFSSHRHPLTGVCDLRKIFLGMESVRYGTVAADP